MTMAVLQKSEVTFSMLMTKVLEVGKTQYITRIPQAMLQAHEKDQIQFVKNCLERHFAPTVETFKDEFTFLAKPSEIPVDVQFECFTRARRDEYMSQAMLAFMKDNKENGRPEHFGLVDFASKLESSTVIPNPQVIDYNNLDRSAYIQQVYRSKWHIPQLDKMTEGLNGGDLIVIMAPTKGYKTTFLKETAIMAQRNGGENIMVCSQEQGTLQMSQQFDAQYNGLSHGKLRRGIDEETMHIFNEHQKSLAASENLFRITPKISSVAEMHEFIQGEGARFDKVFIDGYNLMKSGGGEAHNSIEDSMSQLKDYANKHNIILIGVTQANRTGFAAGANMGVEHLASCFAIGMYADLLLMLMPMEDKGRNFVYCKPALNRHGSTDNAFMMESIYDRKRHSFKFHDMPPGWSPNEVGITDNIIASYKRDAAGVMKVSVEELNKKFGEENVNEAAKLAMILQNTNESGTF